MRQSMFLVCLAMVAMPEFEFAKKTGILKVDSQQTTQEHREYQCA
jgi:hypothetical protein